MPPIEGAETQLQVRRTFLLLPVMMFIIRVRHTSRARAYLVVAELLIGVILLQQSEALDDVGVLLKIER